MAKEVAVDKKAAQKKNPQKGGHSGNKPGLFARLSTYIKGVRIELKRVVWPSRQEVINSSIVVLVTLAFFAVFTFLVDSVASWAIIGLDKLGG